MAQMTIACYEKAKIKRFSECPIEFRRHVLLIRETEGLTFEQAVIRFGVGIASLVRWSKQLAPKSYPLRMYKIDLETLRQDVLCDPDAYLHERASRFGVTPGNIWFALKKLGVTYKKTQAHPKADPYKRQLFQSRIKVYKHQGKSIVYIDESGFAHPMPRLHGYTPRGRAMLWKTQLERQGTHQMSSVG